MSGSPPRLFTDLVYELKTELARHPWIGLPLERLRGHGRVVDERTEVVIEGFPRCASSFVVAAFRLAQEPRMMNIADHTHMPAQVMRGVRLGIPTLVLIRPAEGAVVSLLIRNPDLSARAALRGYVRFYEAIAPLQDRFVTASFHEVVTDLGGPIERLNRRFGTSFVPFRHTEENLARIDSEIEDDYRSRARSEERLEQIIPRPSEVRDRLKTEVESRFHRDTSAHQLSRAVAVYDALTASDPDAPTEA